MAEDIKKFECVNGINVFKISTNRFKTNTINLFISDELSRENVSKNALIPAVLKRGSKLHPTSKEISKKLEDLYGAIFDCGVSKKGENQILHFYLECISDKYAETENLLEECFDVFFDIITNPLVEEDGFKDEYVEQEKVNLIDLIKSRVNNKMSYAVERCFEEMCKGEPFSIYEYGYEEDFKGISNKELYQHYKNVLTNLPMSLYISGDVPDEVIKKLIDKISTIKRNASKYNNKVNVNKNIEKVNQVVEEMNINQGKLSLGYRTFTPSSTEEYYTLMVYNSILGGGVHSKLFQNVREDEGLAYYAFSRLDKYKGLMVISSGIEIDNKEKVENIINKQLEEIEKGNISEYEFESSLKSIETGINSIKDSQLQVVDFYLGQEMESGKETLETILEKIKRVTKSDVVNIAKKIKLDTVYFLTSKESAK